MSIKQSILFFLSLTFIGFTSGCGVDPEVDLPTKSTKAIAGSSSYIINPAITYQEVAPIDGIMMRATTVGGTDAVAGLAIQKNSVRALAAAENGFVTTGELRSIISLISEQSYIDQNISTINEQVFTKYTEFTVGDYSFVTPAATTTVDLSNQIANTLATTTEVLPVGTGITSTEFRMLVTVTMFNSNFYYTVSISPKADAIFQENFALMTALSSGTNYTGINERLVSNTNNFSGVAGASNRADFLFMIDDSGSMGDQQTALSVAANDFESAIALAGMDYNIAVLTTSDGADGNSSGCMGDCYDRIVQDVGIIDNNMTMFKEQVNLIGTGGSATETGIYNSEQALKTGGLLNTAPYSFPRDNTQLSLIILSDEISQYDSRAGNSFNASSNIFTSNNILVNSIVDIGLCGAASFYGPGEDTNGQYDDLAIATGGLVGNICNGGMTPNFSAVMKNIVFQAAGVYHLSNNYVKPNSVIVSVDGVLSSPSIIDGYLYIEGTNSIAFFGTLPAEGADVEVYYEYPKNIDLFSND